MRAARGQIILDFRNAHPWEPYPFYEPYSRCERIHFKLIKFRWWIVKRFVRLKSPLDGETFYD